ncbi:MAG: GGDEF domain-containing protein [Desulfobacter sp.]|nr:GGDEF domain-containing protein [Desulfobacter sp.]
MAGQLDDKIAVLKDRIQKLESQKDILLKELDGLEERFESQDRLYRKYFPVILDIVSKEKTLFGKACKDLGTAMRKKASFSKIDYIFQQMKNAMLKEDIGPVSLKKKKGMFSSFLKSSSDTFIEDFKQSYHEVVNTLKSTLDKTYVKKLENVTAQIIRIQDSSDINDVRENIFALIFQYISQTSHEREKVNVFVKDIVSKILDIEAHFVNSYEQTNSLFSSNTGFETILSNEMNGLKKSSDMAASLDELKIKITQRLTSIENALHKKQRVDDAVSKLAKENQVSFKSGFAKLKKELADATRYSEELEKKINEDQLTGALNRRAYDKKIDEEMDRFLRYGNLFSLLLIDADEFKKINDRYGHSVGDRCLQEIIKRTHPLLRKNDMLARYGGEEFIIIMPETDEQGARSAAEKIRTTIEKIEFVYKNEKVKVTVSIGVSCVNKGDTKHEQVFERVDMAVYKAKENGRNQVMVH